MYSEKIIVTKEDIYCYQVFKKRKFGKRRRTIRRHILFRPTEGAIRESYIRINLEQEKIINGIFSFVSWCPIEDPECEVWLCKIPAGSIVASNAWEYASNALQFIIKAC